MEDQKAPYITQYSKDNWPIYKTMVQAYADAIDAAKSLTCTPNHRKTQRKVDIRFQLLRYHQRKQDVLERSLVIHVLGTED